MKDFDFRNGVLVKYKGIGKATVIPEGVTELEESVTLPDSVTNIQTDAFAEVPSVTYKGKTYTEENIDELYELFDRSLG